MKKVSFFTLFFLLCAVAVLPALGGRDKAKIVRVTGVVRLVGSANFPEIVITNSEGDWYIAADERHKLHELQQQRVSVEGEETVMELRFANGLPAGTRRELRNIRIIAGQ